MPKLSPDQLDPRNNLQYYTKAALQNADVWTPQLIRQEYSRLRSIAQKRLKNLAEQEPDSYAYRHNFDRYAPVKGQTIEELRETLPELARFIAAKTGTVRGIRKQRQLAVATLREHGYTGITTKNIKAFGRFMDEWRAQKLDKTVGSPTAAEAFEFYEEHGVRWEQIQDNFARWLANEKKLEAYVRKRSEKGKEVTSEDILKQFDKIETARKKKNAAAQRRRRAAHTINVESEELG